MTPSQILVLVLLCIFSLPFVIYLSVKLGTYAFFKGRQLFRDSQIGEDSNGNES